MEMVAVTADPNIAFIGLLNGAVKLSWVSLIMSPIVSTGKVIDVSPAGNVNVLV